MFSFEGWTELNASPVDWMNPGPQHFRVATVPVPTKSLTVPTLPNIGTCTHLLT
jgi:hypothetical protein